MRNKQQQQKHRLRFGIFLNIWEIGNEYCGGTHSVATDAQLDAMIT